ncbi:hypothetical protein D3C87_1192460 [compost metagenome]
MAALHAGLAKMAVVQHHDRQVPGLLGADGAQRTHAHQLFAITRDHKDRPFGLRQRQAQPHARGATHGSPKVEVVVPVACGKDVIRRRSQARDDQGVRRGGNQLRHEGAALDSAR